MTATSPSHSTSHFKVNRESGYFETQSGERIIPVGVNYWPGSCGVEMWPSWPATEIQQDLDLVQSLGLNCVRFFLRWQDFEVREGRYEEKKLQQLHALLLWHRERKLMAHPTLFVGYMSGAVFWPQWFRGRNLFSDSELRERARCFARKVAEVCARFPETVLAIDLSNELGCLPECKSAPPADVTSWCATISQAIRLGFPGVPVVSGSEQTQVNMDAGWRFGQQPGCDFYSMHTYPVSAWHSLAFDGMTDPLAQSLLPFYVKCARAWGPVMVQEFGTLFTRGENECESYLRAILPACWEAGANGFLWWCLRDISAREHPYNKFAFEGKLGLVDASDRVKPALKYFLEFVRRIATEDPPTRKSPDVALYWPREYYLRANASNPGNDPGVLSRQLALAHFILSTLGRDAGVVTELGAVSPRGVLLITGAKLTATEAADLIGWVTRGGRLIFHGPDALTWGSDLEHLLGAVPIDFLAPTARTVSCFDESWTFTTFPREIFTKVQLIEATLLAADPTGNPFLFCHRLGQGQVVTCMAEVDREYALKSDQRGARASWSRWYRAMLTAVETPA